MYHHDVTEQLRYIFVIFSTAFTLPIRALVNLCDEIIHTSAIRAWVQP